MKLRHSRVKQLFQVIEQMEWFPTVLLRRNTGVTSLAARPEASPLPVHTPMAADTAAGRGHRGLC